MAREREWGQERAAVNMISHPLSCKPAGFLCSRFWIAGIWVSVCVLAEILPVIQPRTGKCLASGGSQLQNTGNKSIVVVYIRLKTLHGACIMFGAWTKIHVCQVVTWNMCYPVTCLCTFAFSCYFSAPDTFQLARRVLLCKIYSSNASQEIQSKQRNFDLKRRSISNISMTFKPVPSAPVHSNLEKTHFYLFFLILCVSRRAPFLLNQLPLCRPWACAGSVIT